MVQVPDGMTDAHFVSTVVQRFERDGAQYRQAITELAGGEARPGHMVDAAMNAIATFERAAMTGDMAAAADAAIVCLLLMRDVAYTQGKMDPQSLPSA